ncbi:MAG: complex I NDUFA9 subunit family protein [Chloroflexi bacterium]|nr:complex I NDUFA9 subunit family protein [Chloroflexota bacterium]
MTILVTGANGYLGNNLVKRLVAQGRNVRAVVRDPDKTVKRLGGIVSKIEIVNGDVREREQIRPLFEGVSTVIHLAAIAIEKGGATYDTVNHQGTINVVDAAVSAGVTRFVNMSQNGAAPDSPYAFLRSKGRAQGYVAEHAPRWTALRPSAIFGPQDEFFNTFARLLKITPIMFPLVGGGKALFQPVSVEDVVEATVRSVSDDSTIGKELALGGPEVLTLGEIEKRVMQAVGARRVMIPTPIGLLRPAVWVMERVLPGSPVTTGLLDLLALPNVIEDNALVSHFKMDPTPFSGRHLDYLRANTFSGTLAKFLRDATVN